jgi:CubicO group peptidase (beta-lactamase class C family)
VKKKTLLISVAIGLVATVAAIVWMPHPPRLGQPPRGDQDLVDRVAAIVDRDGGAAEARDQLIVVEIDGTASRFAGFGAGPQTEFEIGSISKTFTAALLADSIARGEVRADTRVGDLLDLGNSAAAEITLEQLAGHHSGLPVQDDRLPQLAGYLFGNYRGSDPFLSSPDAAVEAARAASLGDPAKFVYSNLGFGLLGQAIAAAAGTDYATLLGERISRPLGLDGTTVPVLRENLPDRAPTGFSATGRPVGPWTLGSYAPAGGIRSTATDLEHYVRALLDGSAPGIDALEPRMSDGTGGQIGYAWFTESSHGTEITWHNGMTAGFASMVVLDRATHKAVIMLSNTAVGVEKLAIDILTSTGAGAPK